LTYHTNRSRKEEEEGESHSARGSGRELAEHELESERRSINGHGRPAGGIRKTHIMIQHLNDTGVDEDTGADGIQDSDREEGGARVRIVAAVHCDTNGNSNGSDESKCPSHDPLFETATGGEDEGTDARAESESFKELRARRRVS
jgi:hypothetical protein